MNRGMVTLFILLLSGCTTFGNKTELVMANSHDWIEVSRMNEHYYSYECSKFLAILYPIMIYNKTYSAGPIIPIIPVGKTLDERKSSFNLKIGLAGTPTEFKSFLESGEIVVLINAKVQPKDTIKIDLTENPKRPKDIYFNGKNYPDYQEFKLTFPMIGGDINSLKLTFKKIIPECEIPTFEYAKNTGLWHEFILSPGP